MDAGSERRTVLGAAPLGLLAPRVSGASTHGRWGTASRSPAAKRGPPRPLARLVDLLTARGRVAATGSSTTRTHSAETRVGVAAVPTPDDPARLETTS